MEIIWYGTACFAVRTETARLLIDPFVPWKGAKAPVVISDFDDTFPPLTRSEDTGRIEQGWHGVPVIRPEYKKPLSL